MRKNFLVPLLLVLVGLAVVFRGSAAEARASAESLADVVAWTKRHAVAFDTVEAGHGFADLEPLRKMIGTARIVALGEATHGSREMAQMNHRLLEFLTTELGFSVLAIEANLPEARRVHDYVMTGKGDAAAALHGLYFLNWRTTEMGALVEWMRRFNQDALRRGGRSVAFAGLDMQEADVAVSAVQEFFARHDPAWIAKAAEAKQALAGVRPRDPLGIATASLPLDRVRGRRVVLSGWIRTENVTGGYAGLLGRADTAERSAAALDNMFHTGPRGTTDWTQYEIALDVPPNATAFEFGLLLTGKGTAWFDDLAFMIDGEPYRTGHELDLEFEGEKLVGFYATRDSYRARTVPQPRPRGGRRSMEFASLDLGADTSPRAHELWREIEQHLKGVDHERPAAVATARWAAQCARVVNQYLRLNSPDRRRPGSVVRDECMAENVQALLDENPGAKIVLWAHNGHVRRAEGSMGGFLTRRFGDEMVVVGYATGQGSYAAGSSRGRAEFPLQPPAEGSADAMLAAVGQPRSILDLRAARADGPGAWFMEPRPHRLIGGGEVINQFQLRRPVARDYDLIVWIGDSTASVQLPR